MNATLLQQVLIWIIPLLFAITLHEVAHGWIANLLGDPTAKMLGRLTINPIKHIDPIGTILVPLTAILLSGFIFGWAKPVPVTYENFKNRFRDMALVAIAGPLANLLMAIGWAVLIKIAILYGGNDPKTFGLPIALLYMSQAGVLVNISLFILNLLPIPPLDGGRVLSYILPRRASYYLTKIEPYGFIILILLLVTGVLLNIIGPMILWLQQILFALMGIGIPS